MWSRHNQVEPPQRPRPKPARFKFTADGVLLAILATGVAFAVIQLGWIF